MDGELRYDSENVMSLELKTVKTHHTPVSYIEGGSG